MNSQNVLTVPDPQQNRDIHYCIRMTAEERSKLNALAHQLRVPTARMVRHFLFQAVEFYIAQQDVTECENVQRP